ncbi:MAG TPA: alanine racemase [Candidatus Sulfotelmatobacter sp.]|nr:alanine racemase [Candidatus Sulfotelmatobacter sp.]
MIDRIREQVREAYGPAIGRPRGALVTPALILDLDAVRRNIGAMAELRKGWRAALRPHFKAHKSPELARLQVGAGAGGLCAATAWEAAVLTRSGMDDVLVANEVVGREKIQALAAAARDCRLTLAIDDPRNAAEVAGALRAAGSRLDVLIDVDIGMGRGGVRSAEAAVALAGHIAVLPGLRLRGVQGYEGHCMREPDRAKRVAKVAEALDRLGAAAASLVRAGFACDVVSAGGTGTCEVTGNDARVTEVQAGSYVLMDRFHRGLAPRFVPALTVLGTVITQQGTAVVLDCGRKSVGIDFGPPSLVDYPFYEARYLAEEHAIFDVDNRCRLSLGDTAELIPGYAPSTINLYDAYHVVEKGRVVDIWPILPRGPGHLGMLPG